MTTPDLVGLFIEPLERLQVPYMITGGVASVIYGDPRFTRDIDVVLVLGRAGRGRTRWIRKLSRPGFPDWTWPESTARPSSTLS